ncbi:DNA-processing protein DprA [Chamaesiphon polymorphus]|uniref:DNA-protecting protein DprA n=1 Tax=Chamaesiphon polymorphus CCALA 037 TaxID=2107692 RepID=A0A2T1G5E8_9CYAN|nr:DNA-processing protein DprA [Chamaesiphon polymorphus]PSB52478.1 DNA-protecting protein DprA [Chamaesiphon polymorphus CCALA 037]
MSRERIYWLAWSLVAGVGPILLERIRQQFGNLETAWHVDANALLALDGVGVQSAHKIVAARDRIDPDRLLLEHAIDNPHWWTRIDPDYPRLLSEIPSAPSVLYYRGQVSLAENRGEAPTVGIVGTRDPSDYGKRWARKISELLAMKGFTIVSGLAQGIDTEAHTACLEAGGRTIAVVGSGLNIVYPPRNQALAAQIERDGLIVSEYTANTPPDRGHFPARNRIIAGLSRVTIVIEAPTRSGALITAHQANDFGRDVYVLPGSIDNPKAIGCLELLSRGAQPILGLDPLLELLAAIPQLGTTQQLQLAFDLPTSSGTLGSTATTAAAPNVPADLQPVWAQIGSDATNFDDIVLKSELPVASVSSMLIQLELLGLVIQLPGMRYQR